MLDSKHFVRRKYHLSESRKHKKNDSVRSSAEKREHSKQQQLTLASMHLQNSSKFTSSLNKHIQSTPIQISLKKSSFSGQRYKKNETVQDTDKTLNNISALGNPFQQYKRKNLRFSIISSLNSNSNLSIFLNRVQQKQLEFSQMFQKDNYEGSSNVLTDLLNYAIDLNLPYCFSKGIKIMAQFYFVINKIQKALFFYNQSRQSSLLLSHYSTLIQSLIGLAKCCNKVHLEKQAIIFLKKALQYAWLHEKRQLQLQIYDQIGKKYYHMGDVDKAKKYHYKYINAIIQPINSANKMLSKQRLLKNQQLNIQMRFKQLNSLFLVHLKIPIKSINQLSPINQLIHPIRKSNTVSQKYYNYHQKIDVQIYKILNQWFFRQQIQQPHLPTIDWTIPTKSKKFGYIDFKLNQTLKKYTNNEVITHTDTKRKGVQFKQSLQQKILRKIKQPGLQSNWYEKMVNQIHRDHKNKLLNVRNPIRLRGYNSHNKPSVQLAKTIYNQFFQGVFDTQ